jgi:hypothetical protein
LCYLVADGEADSKVRVAAKTWKGEWVESEIVVGREADRVYLVLPESCEKVSVCRMPVGESDTKDMYPVTVATEAVLHP